MMLSPPEHNYQIRLSFDRQQAYLIRVLVYVPELIAAPVFECVNLGNRSQR